MARTKGKRKNRISAAMELPNEIIDLIVGHLYDRQDILTLTRTCRNWSECAIRKLYSEIQLTIPWDCKNLGPLENMISSSRVNLEPTRGLAILPKHTSPNSPPTTLRKINGTYSVETVQLAMPVIQPINDNLNLLIRVLLGKIPINTLVSFTWAHDFALEPETFIKLAQVHGESLRRLQLGHCKGNWDNITPFAAGLQGLQRLSTCVGCTSAFEVELVAGNSSTLRSLELGIEYLMVFDFMNDPLEFDPETQTAKTLSFCKELGERANPAGVSVPVLKLESLKIIGLDLWPFVNGSFRPLTDFSTLTSLILESCCGLFNALPMLTVVSGGKTVSRLPNLQSLTIRNEDDDHPDLLRTLDYFLRSLSPLRTLHLLLSGDYDMRASKEFLKVHGATLRSLVLDERLGRRYDLVDDRLVDLRDAGRLTTIVKYCPNLVELGISVRWSNGDDVPPEGHRAHVTGLLAKLKHLKTLNIRNLPPMNPCSWNEFMHFETMLHGLADDLVKDLILSRKPRKMPQLRIIGLGALVHGDVCDGSVVDGATGIEGILRLQIWAIDYAKNARGNLAPLLTHVANGYPGNVGKDISEDMSIFRPYWLG